MDNLLYKINNSTSNDVPAVVEIREVKTQKTSLDDNTPVKLSLEERAKNQLLNGVNANRTDGEDEKIRQALDFQERQDFAIKQALQNKWYQFVMKVSGFANEPIEKLWKGDVDDTGKATTALVNSTQISTAAQINAASRDSNENVEERNLGKFLQGRESVFGSVLVRAELYLNPICYSHVCEAIELIKNHCNNNTIQVHKLVDSGHSTYFARLVATRIQLSRFYSGRYYSLSANHNRLMMNQQRLLQYFKTYFSSNGSAYDPPALNRVVTNGTHGYSSAYPMPYKNPYAGSTGATTGSHRYFQKLGM